MIPAPVFVVIFSAFPDDGDRVEAFFLRLNNTADPVTVHRSMKPNRSRSESRASVMADKVIFLGFRYFGREKQRRCADGRHWKLGFSWSQIDMSVTPGIFGPSKAFAIRGHVE
ncbi:hypothetical protein M8C21_012565 [Ambrosia artemisiifolia]|uniref:Uncharacterized protein n=1 Tax=Ambrosia artemisiifolia TaxID=4212 RepID=A0AAD5D104_AMBAR|nr:hypothetical protein M8C21_012565 [Ambrosia artemisiifolia]